MKILKADQIKQVDQLTIQREPIASIDLMERASLNFVQWFVEQFGELTSPIQIFCGTGNNGGDGLAIARLLYQRFYKVEIYCCQISSECSPDFTANLNRLPKRSGIPIHQIKVDDPLPTFQEASIFIDAIFGSGLNRPISGYWAKFIQHLNQQQSSIIAVDIPSGLFADQHTKSPHIHAQHTLSFELPKLAFLFPENHQSIGRWHIRPIGLDARAIAEMATDHYYIDPSMIRAILKDRNKYGHKGNYGHALLLMGSYGKVGAAILATRACLRSGAGLVTIHAPRCAYVILQSTVPEAMVSIDPHEYYCSEMPPLDRYKAIALGCGMDTKSLSHQAIADLLEQSKIPLVLDADALNILAAKPSLLKQLPENSILTPHPKEFERLFGSSVDDFARNDLQRSKAQELGIYIVLKGAHTCIAGPDGSCYFNSTGNPGMATGGSGDVLTGILAGLLAQGYCSLDACLLGVYLHGLSGDIAVEHWVSEEALLAGDLIAHLGKAFGRVRSKDQIVN